MIYKNIIRFTLPQEIDDRILHKGLNRSYWRVLYEFLVWNHSFGGSSIILFKSSKPVFILEKIAWKSL